MNWLSAVGIFLQRTEGWAWPTAAVLIVLRLHNAISHAIQQAAITAAKRLESITASGSGAKATFKDVETRAAEGVEAVAEAGRALPTPPVRRAAAAVPPPEQPEPPEESS